MQARQPSQPEERALQEQSRAPGMLDLSALEACCRREIENGFLLETTNASFSSELLRRATTQDNQQVWEAWQRCFAEIVRSWLRRHPSAEQAFHFGDEEGYLAQTFERFQQAVAAGQLQALASMPTVLSYLQVCLNGVLLDALRSKARPQCIPLQEQTSLEEQAGANYPHANQVWERIQALFPDAREQRMAFFLFHCHLSQEEMCCFAPHEFRDVQDIHHLRHEMFQRLVRHADCM